MAFNQRDVNGFPPPNPGPRTIDFASLCAEADTSVEVPVAYAFGGNAPTMVSLGDGSPFEISNPDGSARLFVEYEPYAWNPLSPDWNGQP